MGLKKGMFLKLTLVLTALAVCSGCAFGKNYTYVDMYLIDKEDIFALPIGTKVEIPSGSAWSSIDEKTGKKEITQTWQKEENFTIDRQSFSLSEYYLSEVVQVRVMKK